MKEKMITARARVCVCVCMRGGGGGWHFWSHASQLCYVFMINVVLYVQDGATVP
jgi:hypothetical protein